MQHNFLNALSETVLMDQLHLPDPLPRSPTPDEVLDFLRTFDEAVVVKDISIRTRVTCMKKLLKNNLSTGVDPTCVRGGDYLAAVYFQLLYLHNPVSRGGFDGWRRKLKGKIKGFERFQSSFHSCYLQMRSVFKNYVFLTNLIGLASRRRGNNDRKNDDQYEAQSHLTEADIVTHVSSSRAVSSMTIISEACESWFVNCCREAAGFCHQDKFDGCNSFADICRVARDLDRDLHYDVRANRSVSTVANCTWCGEHSHITSDCPRRARCAICEGNHWAVNCEEKVASVVTPALSTQSSSLVLDQRVNGAVSGRHLDRDFSEPSQASDPLPRSHQSFKQQQQPNQVRICANCGRTGHLEATCYSCLNCGSTYHHDASSCDKCASCLQYTHHGSCTKVCRVCRAPYHQFESCPLVTSGIGRVVIAPKRPDGRAFTNRGRGRGRGRGGRGRFQSQRTFDQNPLKCFNCGKIGHKFKDCRSVTQFGGFRGNCFRCGRQGHIAAQCDEQNSGQPSQQNEPPQQPAPDSMQASVSVAAAEIAKAFQQQMVADRAQGGQNGRQGNGQPANSRPASSQSVHPDRVRLVNGARIQSQES